MSTRPPQIDTDKLASDFGSAIQPPTSTGRGYGGGRAPRKNTGHAFFAGIVLRAQGREMTDCHAMEAVIKFVGFEPCWDRNPEAKDDTGLRKSLSDIMGGHGKLYEPVPGFNPKRFRLPDITDHNDLAAIREYVRTRSIHVSLFMEQYNEAARLYLEIQGRKQSCV